MNSDLRPITEDDTTNPESRNELGSSNDSLNSSNETQPLMERNRYLDPDDPIVSPLNLHKIRLLRICLYFLMSINFILFICLLVSDFISIPGFNTKGKSFLELDLTLVNLLTGLLTLWCFAVPVYIERLLGYASAGLIFLDFVVVLSIPFLRDEFGLSGTLILIWTILNLIINCYIDYAIEKGRKYQEIRYTGRVEKRRSLFELMVMSIKIFAKLLLLLVVWNITFSVCLSAFDSHQKPWGKLISVNNDQFKIHLSCFGDVYYAKNSSDEPQQPILLLEGGQLTSDEEFQSWVEELYHLNKIERYCIWDRPGFAFSDGAPSPVSISITTEFLIEALSKENIEGPFSLIGYDIGGLYSRMFASRSPGNIHSILLVDSWHEDLLKRRPFAGLKNEKDSIFKNILELMSFKTGFKLWIKGVISPLGIVPSIHWLFHPRKYSSNNRIFGSDMYYQPKYIRARLQEQFTSSILSYNEIRGTDIHNIPLGVISSDFMIRNSLNWGKWQRELSKLSENTLEWVIAENSNHKIWESPKGKEQLQQLLLRLVSDKTNY